VLVWFEERWPFEIGFNGRSLQLSTGIGLYFLTLTKVRPASDIKALPSHTTVKATTGRKEQFKTVAHPTAHAEEGLSSKKRGRR
jgi:hypothetical protein